jgi:hypothetical protein
VWYNDLLIGRETHLVPLIKACLNVESARYTAETSIAKVRIRNQSDAPFVLRSRLPFTLHNHSDLVTLEPHSTTELNVKTRDRLKSFEWEFSVLNAVTAPATHPNVLLNVTIE